MGNEKTIQSFTLVIESLIVFGSLFTFLLWFVGPQVFAGTDTPVMSPFTSFSLLLMSGSRLAQRTIETWSKPMTLALFGLVSCGNLSSISMMWLVPELLQKALPGVPATSIMTSLGLVFFCLYQILIVVRETPRQAFILDDILLHLALVPGGLSLLGHVLDVPLYMGVGDDPRTGIGKMEMSFMASYALVSILRNPQLFLWEFLREKNIHRMVFAILFCNQYVAPIVVGLALSTARLNGHRELGIEFFVMLGGMLTTLLFLSICAFFYNKRPLAD